MASRNVPDVPRQLLAQFDLATQIHKQYEKIKDKARMDILAIMGDERTHTVDGWTAIQIPREREHFLKEQFRTQDPQTYEKYLTTRPYVVLVVNGPKQLSPMPTCPSCGVYLLGWTAPESAQYRHRDAA